MYKTSQKAVKYHGEKLGHKQMELDTVFIDGKLKIATVPKLMYRFSTITIKILVCIFEKLITSRIPKHF